MQYFISFANPDRFLGATIVHADSPDEAVENAALIGVNPGGEAIVLPVPERMQGMAEVKAMIGRLAGEAELQKMHAIPGYELTKEENDRLDEGAYICCKDCNDNVAQVFGKRNLA